MPRTESTSFQVHPNDEQAQINLMQKFHWNLLNSQEIKTKDSHLEARGDNIVSVTESEHYVKLTFSRDLEAPNLKDIKQLEQEYFSLPTPKYPKLFPGHWGLWLVATLIYGVGLVAWLAYFFLFYRPKKAAADSIASQTATRRAQIMQELTKYD